MGVDIYGWIEYKRRYDDSWQGAVKVNDSLIQDRNKYMHAFLFNAYGSFTDAIANQRGIPEDASEEFKALAREELGGSFSWIRWDEVEQIQWSEKIDLTTKHPVKYIQVGDEEVEMGGWMQIFDLMATLAKYHGAENVRFVVGFS